MPDFEIMKEQVKLAYTLTLEGNEIHEPLKNTLLKFMFLFNVFEARLFQTENPLTNKPDKTPTSDRLLEICNNLKSEREWFQVKDYDKYGKFFVKRYIDQDGNYDDRNLFRQRTPLVREKVKKAIVKLANEEYDDDLFYSYLEIAYRFRNNLFHGGKDTIYLSQYIECFDMVSWLIHKLLSDMVKKRFIGLVEKYPRP